MLVVLVIYSSSNWETSVVNEKETFFHDFIFNLPLIFADAPDKYLQKIVK